MSSNDYLMQLNELLNKQKQKAICQIGHSNLNSLNALEETETWYQNIIDHVTQNPPEYYVEALRLVEDDEENIQEIVYKPLSEGQKKKYKIISFTLFVIFVALGAVINYIDNSVGSVVFFTLIADLLLLFIKNRKERGIKKHENLGEHPC